MENKVQLCGKYSAVMQISVVVLGVKFLSLTTVTTDFKTKSITYSVKISSLTLCMVHYHGPLCLHDKSQPPP